MNRVVVKPNTATVEQNNRPDQVVGLSPKHASHNINDHVYCVGGRPGGMGGLS